ncbi:MAG: hypothetical protein ACRD1C_09980 [Terriglobales bacterium]
MDPLHHALGEIAAIRGQMARAGEFRGYGPAALTATAGVAAAGGLLQPVLVPDPLRTPAGYVLLWGAAAVLSGTLIGIEARARTRRLHGGLSNAMIRAALEQFLPAGIAGALITLVILNWQAGNVALLPGLWQVIFSLGVFASCRFLPRAALWVGTWYLLTGLLALVIASSSLALDPWVMAAPFIVGQALAAVVLWRASNSGRQPEAA